MGPLVDLLGGGNSFKATAPTNAWQADPSQLQTTDYRNAIQGALQNQPGIQNQQSALAQMLTAQAGGAGPNPALAQLQQTTAQNVNNAASQIASQRGINPALAAKMAADNGAGLNQQAAGQAATMRAQQQLAAQQQLGNVLGQQAGQNIGLVGTAGGLQGQQNQGNIALQGLGQQTAAQNAGLQLGAQQINAGVASQNAQAANNMVGGLMGGAGAFMGMAHGGEIPHYDDGGGVNPQPEGGNSPLHLYMQGLDTKYLKPPTANISPGQLQGPAPAPGTGDMQLSSPTLGIGQQPLDPAGIIRQGAANMDANAKMQKQVGAGLGAMGDSMKKDTTGAYNQFANMRLAGTGGLYADGGSIFAADGGVPGKAEVKGDSEENDKVPAMLSPGEIVIPRSIAQGPDAAAKAHDFVAHLVQRSGSGYGRVLKARGYAEGGETKPEPAEGSGGAGGGEQGTSEKPTLAKIKSMIPDWLAKKKEPAMNQNERKQFAQLKDYSEGGIVEPHASTGRGVAGARHRNRIKKTEKPGFMSQEAE